MAKDLSVFALHTVVGGSATLGLPIFRLNTAAFNGGITEAVNGLRKIFKKRIVVGKQVLNRIFF